MQIQKSLITALQDIIEGKVVKRSKHELIFDGKDVSKEFIDVLQQHNFLPTVVNNISIEPGQRIPAFTIEKQTAYFGWVFWEKFSQLRLRKLFGTVVRNSKGDWLIQLPSNSTKTIFANTTTIFEMDIDRPFEL